MGFKREGSGGSLYISVGFTFALEFRLCKLLVPERKFSKYIQLDVDRREQNAKMAYPQKIYSLDCPLPQSSIRSLRAPINFMALPM